MKRFEFREGKSSKFWQIHTEDRAVVVWFGRIGTAGQIQARSLPSEQAARAEHDLLVRQKVAKGYVPVKTRGNRLQVEMMEQYARAASGGGSASRPAGRKRSSQAREDPRPKRGKVSRKREPGAAARSSAVGRAALRRPGTGSDALDELFVILRVLRRRELGPRKHRRARSLSEAVAQEDVQAVQAFLASGDDLDLVDALATAAGNGHVELVELLLSAGAPASIPNDPARGAFAPLARAAGFGDPRVVRKLLQAEPKPRYGVQALLGAVANGHLECVRALLEGGVAPNNDPACGRVDPHLLLSKLARERGHRAVLDYLEGRTVTFRTDEEAAAAVQGQRLAERTALAALDESIEDGMDSLDPVERFVRATPAAGRSRQQNLERALQIIRSGALAGCIDARPRWGDPALVEAAEGGLTEIVRALLDAGADPNAKTAERRRTPLMTAVRPSDAGRRGDPDICRMLLAAGADPNAKTDVGATALVSAADAGDIDVVRMLLEAGADPTVRTFAGETAIGKAHGSDAMKIQDLLRSACDAWEDMAGGSGAGVRVEGRPRRSLDTARGARDLLHFLGHPEWALMAVQAGVPEVAAAFAGRRRAQRVESDVARRSVAVQPRDRIVPILRLRGHDWTLLYVRVGRIDSPTIDAIRGDVQALSKALDTRAVSFLGEDTSSSFEYRLFEKGDLLEQAQSDGIELSFESQLRARPTTPSKERLADSFFRGIGLYWPTCYPENDGRHARLVLDGAALAALERVDLVVL